MKNFSDNTTPSTTIVGLLPEVHKSDLNASVMGTSFDRHLTKDDSKRVTGYVGKGNPAARVSRQVIEDTPHRQANQLAPTMVTNVGADTSALSFNAFLSQLDLMGVDRDRLESWGNTTKFNWIPPVNIDMLVNFADYFWVPRKRGDIPQYMTIENTCNKATSALSAYLKATDTLGNTFKIASVDFIANTLTMSSDVSILFTPEFVVETTSTNPRFTHAQWTVDSSLYDAHADATVVTVMEPIAFVGDEEPSAPSANQLWYNATTQELKIWANNVWTATTIPEDLSFDLNQSTNRLRYATACACSGSIGFDTTAFDTHGWDAATGCTFPQVNEWTTNNQWIHKSEVKSTANAKRATVPILEYTNSIEMNSWIRVERQWKYRSSPTLSFEQTPKTPPRIELEPIKGYSAFSKNGKWYIYTYVAGMDVARDVDYTSTFVPGYKFAIRDDSVNHQVYTVASAEYREITRDDPNEVTNVTNKGVMCTIIELVEPTFSSVAVGNYTNGFRIEPVTTTQGDVWCGYHAHWLMYGESTFTPAAQQQLTAAAAADAAGGWVEVTSQDRREANASTINIGQSYQQFSGLPAGTTTVPVLSRFKPSAGGLYAIANTNSVRVYLNGNLQQLNYSEESDSYTPVVTAVGTSLLTGQSFQYVTAITFDAPLTGDDMVRIEFGPSAFEDTGMGVIPVRTIENETDFIVATADNTQPVYVNLALYEKRQQLKTSANQYPQFNVYDVVTGEVVAASPLFTYLESSDSPISPAVQRRIVSDDEGKDFGFEQHLVDRSNNIIYGYRDVNLSSDYWYNPNQGKVFQWSEGAWSENIRVLAPISTPIKGSEISAQSVVYRKVIVSAEEPVELEFVNRSLWLHTTTNTLYVRIVETDSWKVVPGLTVQTADPTIRTIWRRGTNNEQFTPQYLDKDRKAVSVGSVDGSWDVVDQWKSNAEHKNYKEVSLTHISTHFSSILTSQARLPGVVGNSRFAMMQSQYNYGLGGTIHDHNDGFDTLISAVNVTNTTPIGVMDFASRENAGASLRIRDDFNSNAAKLLADVSELSFVDFIGQIADKMISRYEANDFALSIYGDTTAYNSVTRQGVRNWVATAPLIGLAPVYRPHMSVVGDVVELFHHDGHRTSVKLNATEQDRIARQLIAMNDTRGGASAKMGKYARTAPPQTVPEFYAAMGAFRAGVYWYSLVAGVRGLQRLSALAIVNTDPGVADVDGNAIPDGVMYYNTSTKATFRKENNAWVQITATGAEDISPLWVDANPSLLLGSVYYEIEKRLYSVAVDSKVAFDYTTLTTTTDDRKVYNALLRQRFMTYVNNKNIRTPFVNTTYTPTNPLTWNYSQFAVGDLPTVGKEPEARASWQSLYQLWFNTPYPHLEPWAIQGYTEKPVWWDGEYASRTTERRWTPVMWSNIQNRIVPNGKILPNGTVSNGTSSGTLVQYAYVCVNMNTDEMLSPYSTINTGFGRSIFNNVTMIVAPDADYVFGDGSPVEWEWSVSAQQPFDNGVIAFQMQPVRFLHSTFGPKYVTVDGLQVETEFKQVYSHEDTLFHGDLYKTNKVYSVGGLNQLYVNFNRFTGYDTNGEFRQLWAGWKPKQTYQFGSIVDTGTFSLYNRNFEVVDKDYSITLANSGVIADHWVDSFNVSLVYVPPAIVRYNNQAAWRMELDVAAEVPRTVSYYGVRSYPFTYNSETKQFAIFSYDIVSVDVSARRIRVSGDQTSVFTEGRSVSVTNKHGETMFNVTSSVYEFDANVTRVNVNKSIDAGTTGKLNVVDVKLPWDLGVQVVIGSSMFVPAPLYPDTPYFVIPTGERTFKLADVFQDVMDNLPIEITTVGDGEMTVSELDSSFFVFGGSGNSGERWYHYVLDKNVVNTFIPPMNVSGMQNLINVIDGYAEMQRDKGVVTPNSSDTQEFDPLTGRQIDWMVETERFIDWAYGIRQSQMHISDSYRVAPNVGTSTLTYVDAVPFWRSGTSVSVSTTGTLPVPLFPLTQYFVVTTGTAGTIRLSLSANASDVDSWITLEDSGSGLMSIGSYERRRSYPHFEMNVTRNVMCVNTPKGVLSDVVEGPYSDIRVQQTIFDQYNRPLTTDQIMVMRQDKQARINVMPNLPNDIDPMLDGDPYNALHIGGAHLFVEGYEHYLMFNDYAVGGALIYDQFYGLAASRFEVDFFEQRESTMRPTLGGFYLHGGQFKRNMEGAVSDVAQYYDTSSLSESSQEAAYARKLLGYNGRKDYLDLIGINGKSQFLFYKGMIQSKGSVNSVNAYTNSRHFVDAAVDEFWAYKVAEFGDKRIRVYPEIKLYPSDSLLDDVRLEFMSAKEEPTDPMFVAAKENGFQLISFVDDARWNNFPQQRAEIISPLFLDANLDELTVLYTGIAPPPPGAESTVQFWINTLNVDTVGPVVKKYNTTTATWSDDAPEMSFMYARLKTNATSVPVGYIGHKISDSVRALRRVTEEREYTITKVESDYSFTVDGDVANDLKPGVPFVLKPTIGSVEVLTVASSVYDGVRTTVNVKSKPVSNISGGTVAVRDFSSYTTEIINVGTGVSEFTRVNSETVRFTMSSLEGLVVLFTINPSTNKINPAKLIDTASQTVVQQMPLWHPAVGIHSPTAAHNIKLHHAGDPALYEFTLNPLSASASGNFWNNIEVNNTWLDTAHLGYVPYYDDAIFPDVNDRLFTWGKLAPWANVNTYMWTESPVHPSLWDKLVESQANDLSIPQNSKATGTPKITINRRTRQVHPATVMSNAHIRVPQGAFKYEQRVLFSSDDTLPSALKSGTKYIIASIEADTTAVGYELITLIHPMSEDVVYVEADGKGQLKIAGAFTSDGWIESVIETDRVTAAFAVVNSMKANALTNGVSWPNALTGKFVWAPKNMSAWSVANEVQTDMTADVVDLYVNGALVARNLVVYRLTANSNELFVNLINELVLDERDIIDIVRPVHVLSAEEESFDPDVDDDGTALIQWKKDYSYSTRTVTTGSETAGYVSTTTYYFWIENATVRTTADKSALSILETARQLETIPTAYTVVLRPEDDPYLTERYGYGIMEYGSIWSLGALSEAMYKIPVQYRECVLRKVSTYLTDNERFVVRFTRDWTLRDELTANGANFNLKDKHEEWQLFRRKQPGRVPSKLWKALTDSVVGYKYSETAVYDASTNEYVRSVEKVRVPSLEREMYDDRFGTDSQYGLGPDQTFVKREYALATIVAYLTNESHNFWPLNIDAFFEANNFNTPEAIQAAMTEIYQTFPVEHVNGIWFETLSDALATKSKYKELMKTSWLALHGVRLMDVAGTLDE